MIIWRLSDSNDYSFARASRRGAWSKSDAQPQVRVQPLVIEWEPGSDVVGDFIWAGFDSDIAIVEAVAKKLSNVFSGFELGPVEMIQDADLKNPKKISPYGRNFSSTSLIQ